MAWKVGIDVKEVQHVEPIGCFPHDDEMPTLPTIAQTFGRMPVLHQNCTWSGMRWFALCQPIKAVNQFVPIGKSLGAPKSTCGPKGYFQNPLLGMERKSPGLHPLNRSCAVWKARRITSSPPPAANSPRSA